GQAPLGVLGVLVVNFFAMRPRLQRLQLSQAASGVGIGIGIGIDTRAVARFRFRPRPRPDFEYAGGSTPNDQEQPVAVLTTNSSSRRIRNCRVKPLGPFQ